MSPPTPEFVQAACDQFDKDNELGEATLTGLFTQYRGNCDRHHVFLKVVALNFLYSTRIVLDSTKIPDVEDVACHIYRNHDEIDSALDADPPKIDIVDRIASFHIDGKKDKGCFSFATKYCSWHRPESYPIWDSNVDVYLRCLRDQTDFGEDFRLRADWRYSDFLEVMIRLKKRYGLDDSFTFKKLDKFLWLEGGRLKNSGAQI